MIWTQLCLSQQLSGGESSLSERAVSTSHLSEAPCCVLCGAVCLSVWDVVHTCLCSCFQAVWLHPLSFLNTESSLPIIMQAYTHIYTLSTCMQWFSHPLNHDTSLVVLTTGKLCADENYPTVTTYATLPSGTHEGWRPSRASATMHNTQHTYLWLPGRSRMLHAPKYVGL